VFRSHRDAAINKSVYTRLPTLSGSSGWNPEFWKKMFDFGIHADLISFGREVPEGSLGLYEAKMVHIFDHRYSSYSGLDVSADDDLSATLLTDREKRDPNCRVTPRCYVKASVFKDRMQSRDSGRRWILSMRDTARSTDERTAIFAVRPYAPSNDKLPSVFVPATARSVAVLLANLSSFVFDYVARQKVGGINLGVYIVEQLPVLSAEAVTNPCPWSNAQEAIASWVAPRVLELTFTAHDMSAFAEDLGWTGPPFIWDPIRRFQLRCELDAAFFHLYGLTRDEVAYVMDTFPIVRRHDEKEHGDYRTKLTILDLYDQMAVAKPAASVLAIAPRPTMPVAASIAWDAKALDVAAAAAGLQVGDEAWATSITGESLGMQALAAVLRALPAPRSRSEVERAVLYVVLPRLLSARFDSASAGRWRRVVGRANLAVESVAVLGIPWQAVVRRAANQGVLVVTSDGKWVAGSGVPTPAPQLIARALVASALVAADAEVTAEELNEMRGLGAA